MKNKKLTALIVFTLVLQLLLPGCLLSHHYNVRSFAMEHSIDYKFRISDLNLYDDEINFWIEGYIWDEKKSVSIDSEGFALMSDYDKKKGDCWFDGEYYRKSCWLYSGEFVYEPDIDVKTLQSKTRKAFGWASDLFTEKCEAYVTAKIYKGVFIPTAIYVDGEKVITIINEA